MGFWDTAGKVAQGALNAIEEKGAEIQSIKMRYEDKSSSELQDIVDDINDDDPIPVDVLGEYIVRSEIVQETKPTGEKTTQKLETVRVTVTWNDPQAAEMNLDSYILVSK